MAYLAWISDTEVLWSGYGLREETCFHCARMVPSRRSPFLNLLLVYLVVIVKLPFSGLVFECVVPGSIPLEHLLFDPIRLIHVKPVVHSLRQSIQSEIFG